MLSFFARATFLSRVLCLIFALLLLGRTPNAAAAGAAILNGVVIGRDHKPVGGVGVDITGPNLTFSRITDAAGRFAVANVAIGRYHLLVATAGEQALADVALTGAGAEVVLTLGELKEIGNVAVVTVPVSRRSGTDVTLEGTQLARLPVQNSLPEILTQLPSAAQGSNGQIHINGDHNGINYYVDGVELPANLNRVLGNEIDPADIGFLDVLEGAYPAQYGDKFAAVLDIGTKAQSGPPGFSGSVTAGSYADLGNSVEYHAPIGHGGALTLATRTSQTARGIDPSVTDFVHDHAAQGSQFVRLTLPVHGRDTLNFDLLNSVQTFQIPPDTAAGAPAATDDNEKQSDIFASLQYRHTIHDHGSLTFGPSFKVSHLLDTADPGNDLYPGSGAHAPGMNVCTDFSDCRIFAVQADRIARDYRFNADYDLRSAAHEIRSGILYGITSIQKAYDITLQPYSALNPSGTFTASDRAPNGAHTQEAYLQDSWKLTAHDILDYGLRADAFQISSSQFSAGFFQVSPRLKLTRILTPRSSVYAYYGRLFVPFSFENISPLTAASLYTAANAPNAGYDLKPQRDSLYEIGGRMPIGSGSLGLRISHKVSTDWIDDTQIGATNLHQDINFPKGRVDLQSLAYTHPLLRSGRLYAALTHSIAVNSANCETQLLQNCASAGPPGGDLVQADHDQHWDLNSGLLLNDTHGGWFSLSGEYGSGLSADPSTCATGDVVNCKVPPHLTFDAMKGVSLGARTTLSLAIQNVLNDRYAITLDNALQGTHYAAPRTLQMQMQVR